jgi:serine/threonine protein kinase
MIWETGKLLGDEKYQIEDELSRRGGFGITYRARHLILKKTVVIKAPHAYRQDEPKYSDFVSCFVKEGQTLDRVAEKQHPNIVRVRDFFYEGDVPCMVMDYVEGETLEDRVTRLGPIPEETIVAWVVTIAQALSRVHELGLVHRDANPANIIISTAGEPILIDFGIALNIQPRATTMLASFAGHKTFAPLEQLEPEDDSPDCPVYRDPKLDVYCLAATLYYAITGEYPKGAHARQTGFNRKGQDCLIPPQTLKPEITDRIHHAILSGMEMDPEDRPESMQNWIALLTTDDGLLTAIRAPSIAELPLQRFEIQTVVLNEQGEAIDKPQREIQYYDEVLPEGLKLRMVMIPGGQFVMGSPEEELHSYNNERPQHSVIVPDFAIGQFTITQAQWTAIAQLSKVKRKLNPNPFFLQ